MLECDVGTFSSLLRLEKIGDSDSDVAIIFVDAKLFLSLSLSVCVCGERGSSLQMVLKSIVIV